MAAAHLERMKIKLNLTDAQAATIKTQQQNMRKQMQSIRENDNLMREQKMEQMKALFAKNKEAMKSVLTPEQFSQLENMHKKFGDRFGAK
jgi:Spy/CpxP family protein refolding chaperone